MKNRILVCSDFLMAKEKEQFSNRRWLMDTIRRPIKLATDISIESFFSSLTEVDKFSRKEFFSRSGIELNINETQFYFEDKRITKDSLDYLKKFIGENDLIIGYELSENTRNILKMIGVSYIDIWLHPVRFLDDIIFAFNSSVCKITEELKKFRISEDIFYLYGSRLRVQSYKGFKRFNKVIANNSALFVGQTLNDKAINRNGKNLTLLDFKSEILELCKKYSVIYYSRHPYVKKGDEEILKFINSQTNIELTDIPAYDLISSGNIKEVISISSSVAIEAKYLGVKSTILYKPIIKLWGKDDVYIPIFQDFVSPHFWSQILSSEFKVKNTQKVEFLDKKDKIRDMLAFYWSYKEVDKLEYLRQDVAGIKSTLNNLKKNSYTSISNKPLENYASATTLEADKVVIETAKHSIEKAKVISFDLFDTLIERPLEKPEDLFECLVTIDKDIGNIANFCTLRKDIRKHFEKDVASTEIKLIERYRKIANLAGDVKIADYYQKERDLDLSILKPKKIGRLLFDYAKQQKKKIIIISDIYYEKTEIKTILSKAGYDIENSNIYLSSEANKLKLTGDLFKYVIQKLNLSPEKIVHIGDNSTSDVKKAQELGIHALYIPSSIDRLRTTSNVWEATSRMSGLPRSICRGLIAHKWSLSTGMPYKTYTAGSSYLFGYGYLGIMFSGFAKWILEESIKKNIKKVYFLSRDGHIIKRCFDVLSKYYQNAPESIYLLASRRAVNVASIKNDKDIEGILSINFSPISINQLFMDRLGVKIDEADLTGSKFSSLSSKVDYKRDLNDILILANKIRNKILENARIERKEIINYFQSVGLSSSMQERVAIVDIGHQGTMQRSIDKLLSICSYGFYFATFDTVNQFLNDENFSAYYQNKISPRNRENDYMNHILMFESIFLNDSDSLCKFENKKPVFLETNEVERKKFISSVHNAAVQFAEDFASILTKNLIKVQLPAQEVVCPYLNFLKNPTPIDASIFNDVSFENKYSGRGIVKILSPSSRIWHEGSAFYLKKGNFIQNCIAKEVLKRTTYKKFKKFISEPKQFFSDSKNPFVRMLRIFY